MIPHIASSHCKLCRIAAVGLAAALALGVAGPTFAAEKAPATAAQAKDDGWTSIFDGKTLKGWKSAEFGGQVAPKVKDGNLILGAGADISGAVYTGKTPKMDYEIELDAQRVDGSDFFVGLTFPVADSWASLIVGGWGGSLVGISSIDGNDAANNSTARVMEFKNKQWYHIRVRVLPTRIQAWIDGKQIVDADTKDHKIDVRIDIDNCKPFGLGSYQSTAAYRNIKIKTLDMDELEKALKEIRRQDGE